MIEAVAPADVDAVDVGSALDYELITERSGVWPYEDPFEAV